MKKDPGFEKRTRNPHSEKYANVQGVVDSGPTVSKMAPQHTDGQLTKMRNEIFKRVSIAKLAETLEARECNESIFALAGSSMAAPYSQFGGATNAPVPSSIYSHQTQHTVISVVSSDAQPLKAVDDILVLDVRPREEYLKCHLQHAESYEKKRLNQDQITPELWRFKSSKGKKLVVYDIDDKTTAEMASLLVQKGWENVYALNGGLDEVAATYGEMLEGDFEHVTAVTQRVSGVASIKPMKPMGGKPKQRVGSVRSACT